MEAKVTVITPSFNSSRFIEACIQSVIAQGSCIGRHVIMDGGSTDTTPAILREYEKKYPLVWRSEPDKGQSDALSKAITMVDTEYFIWLNADDVLIDGTVSKVIRNIAEVRTPSIIYGDYSRIDASGRTIAYRKQPSFNYWDCLYGYLTVQNVAALFRTSDVIAAGGFDPQLKFAMDYDLVLRLASRGQVAYMPIHIGAFRMHEGSKTSNMQDTCRRETTLIRMKYSHKAGLSLLWRRRLATARVACRMLREGCVPCRIRSRFCR